MKKFFAKLASAESRKGVLMDGDRMTMDERFVYVYSGDELQGIIDKNDMLYGYISETTRQKQEGAG
jgi:hypothetical protein